MQVEQKEEILHHDIEKAHSQGHEYEGDDPKALGGERVELTEEDVSTA